MDAQFFHSREEGCAVDAQAGSSSFSATHAPFAVDKCAHNLQALPPGMLVCGALIGTECVDRFFHNSGDVLLSRLRRCLPQLVRIQLAELAKWRLKYLAVRQNYRALNEVFQLPDVAGPLPVGKSPHYGRRHRFNLLLHLFCELLYEI